MMPRAMTERREVGEPKREGWVVVRTICHSCRRKLGRKASE